jgi:hypothetical protein
MPGKIPCLPSPISISAGAIRYFVITSNVAIDRTLSKKRGIRMLVVFATELMPDEYTSEEKINRMIEGFPERAIVVAHDSDLFNPYGLSIALI